MRDRSNALAASLVSITESMVGDEGYAGVIVVIFKAVAVNSAFNRRKISSCRLDQNKDKR